MELRLNPKTNPNDVFLYDLRGDYNGGSTPATIEKSVHVNFYGTVFLKEKLDLGGQGFIPLDDGINYKGESITLDEFYQN